MSGVYLDTSALGRVLLAEPDAPAIRVMLGGHDAWWSSELLVVELRRLAAHEGLQVPAERFINTLRLVPVDSESLQRASRVEPVAVRSLDAIHLEAALSLRDRGEIGAVITYDRQFADGCVHRALPVRAPTAI